MIYDNDDLVEYDARVYRANANNYVRLETANPDDYEYFSITDYDAMRKIPRHHDCINPYNAARSSFGQPTEYVYGEGNKLPLLVRIDSKAGHGAGKPTAKVIEEYTDVWSFVFFHLGIKL